MVNQQGSSRWNLGRFVQTLSYFGAIPILSRLDWFQQWWGSRPDPRVDSSTLADRLLTSGHFSGSPHSNLKAKDMILVIGATTKVGERVLQRLQEQGERVRAIVPNQPGAKANLGAAVEPIELDLMAESFPQGLLQSASAVIYCIGDRDRLPGDVGAAIDRQFGNSLVQAAGRVDSTRQLFDFTQPSNALQDIWGALDDVVMGGVSQSSIRFGSVASFAGHVSTANSGGFASVRTRNFQPPLNLAAYDGIELRVKGDGNRYKFMLRDETRWDGIAYCYSFDTVPETWSQVRIPFSQFIPVFRAKTVGDRRLDCSHICACQLMLSKFEYDGALNPRFQPGFFQLEVASIQVYQQRLPQLILVNPQSSTAAAELETTLRESAIPYTLIQPQQQGDHPIQATGRLEALAEQCIQALHSPGSPAKLNSN